MNILGDDDSDVEQGFGSGFGSGAGSGRNNSKDEDEGFTINHAFAKKYVEKKKKEELTQLTEQYKSHAGKKTTRSAGRYGEEYDDYGVSDESSDSDDEPEDETGELITPQIDAQIMKTIAMIRQGREEVYDPKTTFFSEAEMEASRREWELKKKSIEAEGKPVTLKDFHRQNLLKQDGQDAENTTDRPSEGLTHVQEQSAIKAEFKAALSSAAAGDDDDDDLFTVRPKTMEEVEAEDREYTSFLLKNMGLENPDKASWEKMKSSSAMDVDEVFLMDYVLNRGWMDTNAKRMPTYDEIVGKDTDKELHQMGVDETIDDDEDEEAIEAADRFERKHNFRFEEEDGAQIQTHARNIDGLVRRKDDSRKRKREEIKERKAEEKKRKEEELKRLKNLKKEELRKKLQKIRDMAGGDHVGLDEVDLEKEFDPAEYDARMSKAFDDSYYNAEDATMKPQFDDDIEVDNMIGPLESTPKLKKPLPTFGGDDDENFNMDADWMPGGEYYDNEGADGDGAQEPETPAKPLSKKERKKLEKAGKNKKGGAAPEKMSLDEYLDEYYQLDYEDLIGDLPTRFKYRQVEPETYGLKPDEILDADDTELRKVVALKKLAPYRRPEAVERDMEKWKKSKKKRLREFREQLKLKREQEGGFAVADSGETGGADAGEGSKKRKRVGGWAPQQTAEERQAEAAEKQYKSKKMKMAGIDEDRLATYSGSKKSKKSK
ncbi:KRI1-like family C-terminal-domain-containing protein [Entophlyctis helioformis]|nr:KRI1-like family C-terminal-domain-containing protein [Entophlyctis helioformis]